MKKEVKEMIDLNVESYYHSGCYERTIFRVYVLENLDNYFSLFDDDIREKYEKEDSDEIFRYYIEKLCDYCNLDYRLANNRVDYIVYPKVSVEIIKEVLIEALDNPYDTFELSYLQLCYEEGLQEDFFTGWFNLMDREDNLLKSYDVSTYWNTQSEILTMGNKILEDIAQEILDYINK